MIPVRLLSGPQGGCYDTANSPTTPRWSSCSGSRWATSKTNEPDNARSKPADPKDSPAPPTQTRGRRHHPRLGQSPQRTRTTLPRTIPPNHLKTDHLHKRLDKLHEAAAGHDPDSSQSPRLPDPKSGPCLSSTPLCQRQRTSWSPQIEPATTIPHNSYPTIAATAAISRGETCEARPLTSGDHVRVSSSPCLHVTILVT